MAIPVPLFVRVPVLVTVALTCGVLTSARVPWLVIAEAVNVPESTVTVAVG